MSYESLKERHRAERERQPPNLVLRVHRALSWLNRAEQLTEDPDGRFIFLWISFNAAYATEIDEAYRLSEQATFREFIQKLLRLDTGKRLERLVWGEFSGTIRVLLDNEFVFQDFWDFHNGKLTEEQWKKRFAAAKTAAAFALTKRETDVFLGIVMSRIYTLRNQLISGGATWNSAVNREQVRDCVNFLGKLVPLVIEP